MPQPHEHREVCCCLLYQTPQRRRLSVRLLSKPRNCRCESHHLPILPIAHCSSHLGPLVRIASEFRQMLVPQNSNFLWLRRLCHEFLCRYVERYFRGPMLIVPSCAYLLFTQESARGVLVPDPHHIFPVGYMPRLHCPR